MTNMANDSASDTAYYNNDTAQFYSFEYEWKGFSNLLNKAMDAFKVKTNIISRFSNLIFYFLFSDFNFKL
jgi:hypothetical protein